jgi:hypothetical protein
LVKPGTYSVQLSRRVADTIGNFGEPLKLEVIALPAR